MVKEEFYKLKNDAKMFTNLENLFNIAKDKQSLRLKLMATKTVENWNCYVYLDFSKFVSGNRPVSLSVFMFDKNGKEKKEEHYLHYDLNEIIDTLQCFELAYGIPALARVVNDTSNIDILYDFDYFDEWLRIDEDNSGYLSQWETIEKGGINI